MLFIAHHGDAQNLSHTLSTKPPLLWAQALLSCGASPGNRTTAAQQHLKSVRPGVSPPPWQVGEARQSRALAGSCSSPMGAPPLHHNLSCVPSVELRNQPHILWEGENLSTTIFLPVSHQKPPFPRKGLRVLPTSWTRRISHHARQLTSRACY